MLSPPTHSIPKQTHTQSYQLEPAPFSEGWVLKRQLLHSQTTLTAAFSINCSWIEWLYYNVWGVTGEWGGCLSTFCIILISICPCLGSGFSDFRLFLLKEGLKLLIPLDRKLFQRIKFFPEYFRVPKWDGTNKHRTFLQETEVRVLVSQCWLF